MPNLLHHDITQASCVVKQRIVHLLIFRARPDIPTQKLEWLSRHDRENGDLCGALRLMKGMPVAMTVHIHRSIDKHILKGRAGHVHSWVLAKDESITFCNGKRMLIRVPRIVVVKFFTEDGRELDWTLPGLSEPGVYTIVPITKDWFLDKGRLHPNFTNRAATASTDTSFRHDCTCCTGTNF